MRLRSVALISFALVALANAGNAECNAAQMAEIRNLQSEYSEISKALRKAIARADGQLIRQMALNNEANKDLPALPEKPSIGSAAFNSEGDLRITCEDAQTTDTQFTEARQAIDTANQALAIYIQSVAQHAEALELAENRNTGQDTAVADAETPDTTEAESAASDANDTEVANSDPQPATDVVATRKPLSDPENENLFRRVISLPDATLRSSVADDANTEMLPTFSVLYVFGESKANGQDWLEVGPSLREDSIGWITKDETLSWSSMLVMNFAPQGSRSQVLFFKNATALTDLVSSAFYATEAADIYDQLRSEREALQADPNYEPNWPSILTAVEPETAVTFTGQPYLLPILDWREEAFDGVDDTVLLKVAAVPANASDIGSEDQNSFENSASMAAAASDGIFRLGITFVLDTTVSMSPFIERTYQTVEGFYNAFSDLETAQNISFGLVGFRDNIDRDREGLGYAARVFSPLDIDADPSTVLATARQMVQADVPTVGFQEDGYLGVHTALNDMDWDPFDSRLIVMVTDASSREGDDPLAGLDNTTAERLVEMAKSHNVAILVIHLKTPANQQAGDFERAREQYLRLTTTGDIFTEKYFAFDGTSDEEFAAGLGMVSNTIASSVFKAAAGELVVDFENLEPVPSDAPSRLAQAVQTEIFRAQLETLSAESSTEAPSFLEAWASDKDLTDPSRSALNVSVFLTRNQLSSLDKQLASIVHAFRSGGDDPKAFFENLQVLATEMSTDPDQPIPAGRDLVKSILPSFLSNLPYRSQVLQLDNEYWLSLGVANQQEFIENLESKRKIYKDLEDDISLWRNFGANDPGLEATPVSLSLLP